MAAAPEEVSIEERRRYPELDETEQAIVKVALPRETVTREEVLDELDNEFEEEDVREAFTRLCDENRLFRIGNRADYVMVSRDLF